MKKIIVKQNEEKPMAVEIIAESIKNISDGIKKLRSGPLNDKALVLLIQHAAPYHKQGYNNTKVSVQNINAVLQGIESLEETYLKKNYLIYKTSKNPSDKRGERE